MTPSQMIVRESGNILTSIDASGRRLSFRRLTALDTLRLFKAAGPSLSQNESWLSMAGLAFSILEIDGVPIPAATSEAQIEGLVDRLGDDGLAAIANVLNEEPQILESRADVGNLLGTLS